MNPSFICLYNKLVFIVDQLQTKKRLTRKEISDLWADNKDYSYGEDIPRETFYYNIRMIEEMFHVIIEHEGGYWKIANPEALEDSSTPSRLYRNRH